MKAMSTRTKRENPRRSARRLAKQLRSWISSALVGHCCPVCGDAMEHEVCSCGRCELNPVDFQTAQTEEV